METAVETNLGGYILVDRHNAPKQVKHEKITAKGWVRLPGRANYFKPAKYHSGLEDGCGNRLYIYQPERMAELNAEHERVEAYHKERREAELARQARIDAQNAAELEEAKAACGSLLNLVAFRQTTPDGRRMVWLNLPVKPCYAERKGAVEAVIVTLKDVQERDWDSPRNAEGERPMVVKVELAYTYHHAGSGSFSSVSTGKFDTDESAIWYAVRSQYHSW